MALILFRLASYFAHMFSTYVAPPSFNFRSISVLVLVLLLFLPELYIAVQLCSVLGNL